MALTAPHEAMTMFKTKNLAVAVALGAVAASAACAQILGIDPNPTLSTTTTTATGGGTTTTTNGACTPGDAGAPGNCPANQFCDPTSMKCVAACKGTLGARITTDFTGTAQDIAQPFAQAIYDYLRDLKASGGLRGCAIDVDMKDGNYTATVTSTVVTNWSADPSWASVQSLFIFGTAPTTTVSAMPVVAGKVIFPGSYAGSLTSPVMVSTPVTYTDVNSMGNTSTAMVTETSPGYPYIFFPATDYSTGIRIAIGAAWQKDPGKIAMVYDKTCAYCINPLVAGKQYMPEKPGMTLAPDIDSIPQTSDATQIPTIAATIKAAMDAEIAKVKANPGSYYPIKWLWCGNSVTSCAGVAKGAGQANADIVAQLPAAQQWKIRVIANNWGIGETSSALCGTGGNPSDCDDVLYGLFPVPRYGDTNASGMQAMIDLHDKWAMKDSYDAGPGSYEDVRFVQGYAAALMWRKAVEAAIDAGHTSPTGDDIKHALEQFSQVVLEQMTAAPVSFSAKDHRPQGGENIYYLHQGVLTFDNTYSLTLDSMWLGY